MFATSLPEEMGFRDEILVIVKVIVSTVVVLSAVVVVWDDERYSSFGDEAAMEDGPGASFDNNATFVLVGEATIEPDAAGPEGSEVAPDDPFAPV